VKAKLGALIDTARITFLNTSFLFGDMPIEAARRSVTLFMKESRRHSDSAIRSLPRLRGRAGVGVKTIACSGCCSPTLTLPREPGRGSESASPINRGPA
jgi:hypothetical protein